MKKISLCCLVILLALLFTACGSSSKAKDTDTATSATYISEMEARIYFYEITSVYRYELMTLGEEEIKNGVDPKYWDGLADEVDELTLSEMTGTYISEEEKTLLSTTYGVTANNVVFGIYRISDVQAGIDYLFGSGRYDVSAWNHNNVDILKTNIFGTASGYFLCSKSEEKSYANQIYKVISVKGGEETATIVARAVSVDTINEKKVCDLTVEETVSDDSGNETTAYKTLENVSVDSFGLNDDFDTNMSNMHINEKYLGTVKFTFGLDGIAVYLENAVPQQ